MVSGNYDPEKSISENTAIASPLLSRFDLVLTLLDTKNPDWDRIVSSFILEGKDPSRVQTQEPELMWNFDRMQAYFLHIKKLRPLLSPGAHQVLSSYYQRQRGTDSADAARTTVRLLQSCIRLAQGHARLMCREEVSVQDAVSAVLLLECSTASSASLVKGGNALHTAFPADPVAEYRVQAKLILQGLRLEGLWREESARIDQLLASQRGSETATQAGTQAVGRPDRDKHLSQVMKAIQINRLPSYPPPEQKQKRKRKVRKSKDKESQDPENRDPEAVTEKNDSTILMSSSDSGTEDEENPDNPRKRRRDSTPSKDRMSSTLVISKPSDKVPRSLILFPPEFDSQLSPVAKFPSVGKSQGSPSLDASFSPSSSSRNETSIGSNPSPEAQNSVVLSRKTVKKLQSFARVDSGGDSEQENSSPKLKNKSIISLGKSPPKPKTVPIQDPKPVPRLRSVGNLRSKPAIDISSNTETGARVGDPDSRIKETGTRSGESCSRTGETGFKTRETLKTGSEFEKNTSMIKRTSQIGSQPPKFTANSLNSLMSKIKNIPVVGSSAGDGGTIDFEEDLDIDFDL